MAGKEGERELERRRGARLASLRPAGAARAAAAVACGRGEETEDSDAGTEGGPAATRPSRPRQRREGDSAGCRRPLPSPYPAQEAAGLTVPRACLPCVPCPEGVLRDAGHGRGGGESLRLLTSKAALGTCSRVPFSGPAFVGANCSHISAARLGKVFDCTGSPPVPLGALVMGQFTTMRFGTRQGLFPVFSQIVAGGYWVPRERSVREGSMFPGEVAAGHSLRHIL